MHRIAHYVSGGLIVTLPGPDEDHNPDSCGVVLRKFVANRNTRSHVWYRWFNEAPVLMLLAAVILVVVKPF